MNTRLTKRIAWLLAPVLCAALVGFIVWRGPSAAYTRFVSPPLPDGTRYTFLYPPRYIKFPGAGPGVALRYHDSYPHSYPQPTSFQILMWKLFRRAPSIMSREGHISVQIAMYGFKPTNSRHEIKSRTRRVITITDARSKADFFVQHTDWDSDAALFDAESKMLSQSFRLLPPGAPVPAS